MMNKKTFQAMLVNSSLGNILEWYDFGLFTIFSGLFSSLFFPLHDHQAGMLATFSLFAIGFFCRPIGALIFGYFGDTIGRAKTLRMSVLMISLPTILIAVLPTYQSVGLLAPVLLLLVRIWQGISIGGEYSGNLIYLAESAPNQYRATYTSFVSMGSNIGILLASLVGIFLNHFFSPSVLQSWGWRLPYLISGLFCIGMYLFRLKLSETEAFQQMQRNHLIKTNPIQTLLKNNVPQLLRTMGLVCMGSTFYYFCFVYLPIYLSQGKKANVGDISTVVSVFIGLMILLVPMAGYLCDKVGRRNMMLFNACLIAVCTVPGFYFLQYRCLIFLVPVFFLFTVASSLEQGATSVTVVENFPVNTRYTGVSFGFNLGNGLLGGTVPVICSWLSFYTANELAPAFYISACAIITGLVVYFFTPETKGVALLPH